MRYNIPTMKKIGIFGVNGFIGHHLTKKLLDETDWIIYGADISETRVAQFADNDRFKYTHINIRTDDAKVEEFVKSVDVVLPFAAIATPTLYIEDPLYVFELDFEANLQILRHCVKYNKRIIWPSTSEVYGMCTDDEFHPEASNLVMGPINKERWIYSSAKQLMDRLVWAYGNHNDLKFTIFRPFNWVGSGLDNIEDVGTSKARAITQFLGNILLDRDIVLVDGGHQSRSFTYVEDGVEALKRIIENKDGAADGKIYNIGNPDNNMSIRLFAEMLLEEAADYPLFAKHLPNVKIVVKDGSTHYGKAYQDMQNRVPCIQNIVTDLGWEPKVGVKEAIRHTLADYQEMLGK